MEFENSEDEKVDFERDRKMIQKKPKSEKRILSTGPSNSDNNNICGDSDDDHRPPKHGYKRTVDERSIKRFDQNTQGSNIPVDQNNPIDSNKKPNL